MKTLDDLIAYFEHSESVVSFKNLEHKIMTSPKYKARYEQLLAKQKQLVNSRHYGLKTFLEDEKIYDAALDAFDDDPLIHQYLFLQEEINRNLQMVAQLIEAALNNPFR